MDLNSQSPRLVDAHLEIGKAESVLEALRVFQRIYSVDFVTYHLAHTVADVVDAPFVNSTYSDTWVSRYLLSGYVKVDPVVKQGFLRQMPFDWREVEITSTAYEFLRDAQNHGVGRNGYSIPIVDKKRRALLSLNSRKPIDEWSGIVDQFRGEWLELAVLIHKKAIQEIHGEHDPVPSLSKREKECLHWTALGKTSTDIAKILGLSEHTTQTYLSNVRHKFGGGPITSAVALAIQLRLINPYGNTQT
ncbi:helix-turn-helix transcriptional regulator [Agrobacterium tumefaciens]|uniref:helix-turn-helix transcriptional regulator n=1 Tax=Agrobacterium tumefaciens TaxID=358 RepID=UPI0015742E29|nr:LuxR family transcriptional regulator [Agrobacterium tumefaciens]NTC19983.1 LuxR family transcriptional regulator [Agrobacterium tumefaciens]